MTVNDRTLLSQFYQRHLLSRALPLVLRAFLILLLRNLVLRTKLQTHTIDTMPLIRRCRVSLSLKHMPQMPSTICAHNLRPLHPKTLVRMSLHCSRNGVEKGRPPASGLEFVICRVEGCVAGSAGVDAGARHVLVEFTGVGSFSALLADDAELLWRGNV